MLGVMQVACEQQYSGMDPYEAVHSLGSWADITIWDVQESLQGLMMIRQRQIEYLVYGFL